MKKLFLPLIAVISLTALTHEAKAQTPFKSAIGIVFDGNNSSNVGIQYKTALKGPQAAQFQASFSNRWVNLGADWQYELAIPGAEGLAWYAGVGAEISFWNHNAVNRTYFAIRPQVGLEYKLPTLPIAMHLDYKPSIGFTHKAGFQGDGFTFGVKYIIR